MSSNISNHRPVSPLTIQPGETRRLTFEQAAELKIRDTSRSDLPQFRDSIFLHASAGQQHLDITRMPDTVPAMGVAVALSVNQTAALLIRTATLTSIRPELADSKFAVSPAGRNGYIVTRLPADAEPAKAK